MLPNFKFGNTQNVGWYPKLRVYPIYRVIPDTPGLPEISGNTRYFGLPATRWFSKMNRVGSGIKWNTGYRVGFGYPLDTALHPSFAEARVAHLIRAAGRQESEHLLRLVVGQYRRLLSVTAVRAQAMLLLARVGLITSAAKEAAARRAAAMRMEGEMRSDRRAQ